MVTNKKPQDLATLRLLNLRTYVRLIFYFNVLNNARLTGSGVINAHLVLRCQHAFHDMASSVHDSDWSVERERDWSLALVSDHDRFIRLIRGDGARRVGRARRRRRGCRRCGCLFGCGCAGLRKCERRNRSTSQCNDDLFHSVPFVVVSFLRLSSRGKYSGCETHRH